MDPAAASLEQHDPRIVVLLSGSGSNLQALIDACHNGDIRANIVAVISNKPGAFGLERAKAANIPAFALDHTQFDTRERFDRALAEMIEEQQPSLIVLAGFMRILSEFFTQQFAGKLLNIHPSLLPKYTGLNTHQRAIDAQDSEAGATVHFVTGELDGGPPVLQARVPIHPDDTAADLTQRVLVQEHKIYPQAVAWFVDGRLALDAGVASLDGRPLPEHGQIYEH
ncbi:phosphoribosylglycinamide formyltransferase [Pseudomonadales bacterium]|jgi:phosphoribosylglycinamide formyltransferase-1|nr:phosphoribosylglycinamide formyltransferase [Pseudomonadales bacterium]